MVEVMVRVPPPDRLKNLLIAAAEVFVAHGFQRTQMDDVAERLGVSKGTLYRSVESKEALLVAVLDHGDTPETLPAVGPLVSSTLTEISSGLRDRLGAATGTLELWAAVEKPTTHPSSAGLGDEVERLAADVFEMMSSHRTRIMVLDRCAPELPMLGGDWYEQGRYALVDLWSEYLQGQHAHLEEGRDVAVLARTVVELLALWAVKMPWDPAPRPYAIDLKQQCAAMVRTLITGAQ